MDSQHPGLFKAPLSNKWGPRTLSIERHPSWYPDDILLQPCLGYVDLPGQSEGNNKVLVTVANSVFQCVAAPTPARFLHRVHSALWEDSNCSLHFPGARLRYKHVVELVDSQDNAGCLMGSSFPFLSLQVLNILIFSLALDNSIQYLVIIWVLYFLFPPYTAP